MGIVYVAKDQRIGRRVALKTIAVTQAQLDDSTTPREFHTRLQREAEVSGSLSHPNIVALYEAGYEDDRISYLAMEFVEGQTLLAMMKAATPSPLDLETSLRVMSDVLRGLTHAHNAGIVHRDIKPANVLITNEGVAKITDFGIARPQNSSLTAAGALMGTPNYMSPEQILGQTLTPKADVFSAGVMLYEMLTAVKPFAGGDLTGTLHNILRVEVPHVSDVNPAVPRHVGDVIARMMAKDPGARPAAAEAAQLLAPAQEPVAIAPPPAGRPWIWIAVAAAAILIPAITGIAIATHRVEQPTVEITPAKMQEFEEKKRELDRAESALQSGKYQEALDRYNAYLAKYPTSTTAVDGRDRAREALAKQNSEANAPKPKHRRRGSRDDDISPSELLDRLKRIFKH